MANSTLQIILNAVDNASGVVRQASGNIAASFKEAETASKDLAFGLLGVGTAAAGFIGYGAKIAGDLEASRQGFITLLGSASQADQILAQIKHDAAATPFELPGLIQANQLLTSVTKDAGKSEELLLNVGKALSAMGKGQPELDRIIINLQQIGAVGHASMIDIRQFAFNGIPIFDMLTQATGKTGKALDDMISSGGVTFGMLTQMFNQAGTSGGRFADAFKNQAGTFNQLVSNMHDTFNIFAADLLQKTGIFDVLKQAVAGITDYMTAHRDDIVAFTKDGLGWLKDNGPLIAGIIVGALTPAAVAFVAAIVAGTVALAPFFAAGAAIGLAVQHWRDLSNAAQPAVSWMQQNRTTLEAVASVIGFALLPQLVLLAGQLVKNTALWVIHNAQAIGNAIVQSYLFITAGWQTVAVLVAQAAQIGIATAAWLAQNVAAGVSFVLSGQLTGAFIASRLAMLAGAAATGIMTAAQWALNVALDANPIGLIIIAIAGLVAGLIVASGHWNDFKNIALGAINPVVDAVRNLVGWMGRIPGVQGSVDAIRNIGKQLHLPGFATGGIVPGPLGAPTLAIVHGGEAITPPGKPFAGGQASAGGPVINIQHVNNYNPTDLSAFAREISWRIS